MALFDYSLLHSPPLSSLSSLIVCAACAFYARVALNIIKRQTQQRVTPATHHIRLLFHLFCFSLPADGTWSTRCLVLSDNLIMLLNSTCCRCWQDEMSLSNKKETKTKGLAGGRTAEILLAVCCCYHHREWVSEWVDDGWTLKKEKGRPGGKVVRFT